MPKPDLTALTGGYRKTPVLQIGAEIYWGSQLIMRGLERRHPSPGFYPAGRRAADAFAWWAEKTMLSPGLDGAAIGGVPQTSNTPSIFFSCPRWTCDGYYNDM